MRFKGYHKSKNKGKPRKKRRQLAHFRRRLHERFGIVMNDEQVRELVRWIQSRSTKAQFIERQSQRVSMFRVGIEGQTVVVVYDSIRHIPVTAMKEEFVCSPEQSAPDSE